MKTQKLYSFLLFALFLAFGLVLLIAISNGIHYDYRSYADDINFIVTRQDYGIWNGVVFLFNHHNGRLVSHLLFMVFSPLAVSSHLSEAVFYVINVVLFIITLSFFLRRYFNYRYGSSLSTQQTFITAVLFYCLFFFFYFGKRFEFWYWLSTIFIYEYSIMLMFILNGLLLENKRTKLHLSTIAFISICLGFMAETHAVAQLIILAFLLLREGFNPFDWLKKGYEKVISGVLIAAALLINYFSYGNQHKLLISKTQVADNTSLVKSVYIFLNDLLLSWDSIAMNRFKGYEFNSLLMQVLCLVLLYLLLKVFLSQWKLVKSSGNNLKPRVWQVLALSLIILLVTYAISAVLYANLLDFLVDRCKFIGCFAVFFGLFDVVVVQLQSRILADG